MGFNTVLQVFLPKDKIFSSLFENAADTVEKMAILLKEMINADGRETRFSLYEQIENLEHINDDTTHEILAQLGKNFITLYDREDIHYTATALDDIADYIYASAKKIVLYDVDTNDIIIQKLTALTVSAAGQIKIAVYGLRAMKNIPEVLQALLKVNSIETEANDIYDEGIEKLFDCEQDMKLLVKKKDIYHSLEKATDRCTDAVNVIETVILKYA